MEVIKAVTALDKKMQRELSGGIVKLSKAFLIIGVAGLFSFAAFQIVAFILKLSSSRYFFAFIVFVIFAAISYWLEYRVNKAGEAVQAENKLNEYEFSESSFKVTERAKEKIIAEREIPYSSVVKLKESKNFLFLYMNSTSAYPVSKAELGENVSKIKKLITG